MHGRERLGLVHNGGDVGNVTLAARGVHQAGRVGDLERGAVRRPDGQRHRLGRVRLDAGRRHKRRGALVPQMLSNLDGKLRLAGTRLAQQQHTNGVAAGSHDGVVGGGLKGETKRWQAESDEARWSRFVGLVAAQIGDAARRGSVATGIWYDAPCRWLL